jgi:hypothetical protein
MSNQYRRCDECSGSGYATCYVCKGANWQDCHGCGGTSGGSHGKVICPACGGSGKVKDD